MREGKRRRWRNESKKEKADVLEPEKCPLPREVGPFFPLLTGGENIYETNREHVSRESWDAADSKAHFCSIAAATREEASFQNAGLSGRTAVFDIHLWLFRDEFGHSGFLWRAAVLEGTSECHRLWVWIHDGTLRVTQKVATTTVATPRLSRRSK